MKILQINSAKNWGGGEVYTINLCQKLIAKGYNVMLACRPGSDISRIALKNGITLLELPLTGAVDFRSAWKLSQYCRKNGIDIVHVHLARDYWIARYLKAILPGIHLVFTRHLLNPIRSTFFHKWLFKKVDKVIAVSNAVKESLLIQNLLSPERIITIYNGIDVNLFASALSGTIRKELGFDKNLKLIGIIGQIAPHKGSDLFIASAVLVSKQYPNTRFLLVGNDFQNGKYIEELRQISLNSGIGDKVFFLGQRTDVPEIMKDLDIFVLASKYESFGLVLVEAMAAGVPVVSTIAGGAVKEIIINDETGVIVNDNQPITLANTIISLLKDEKRAVILAKAGQERAFEKFDLDQMV
ncbi:MAG: glycosyltransferase family 4 protein, partial [Bacteroidota bacterium]